MSGTVTVNDAGMVSGTGSALALYNTIAAIQTGAHPLPNPDHPDSDWTETAEAWRVAMLSFVVKMKRAWAREAQAHADSFDSTTFLQGDNDTSSNAATDTDLKLLGVKSGDRWRIEVDMLLTCSGIGGVRLGLKGPALSAVVGYAQGCANAQNAFESAAVDTLGTPVGVFSNVAGGQRMARLVATVFVATDGDITFQIASVTNGQTSTVAAGATLRASRCT